MELEDLEFGIGFGGKIVLGEKSKKNGVFKGEPIVVTDDVFRIVALYLLENNILETFCVNTYDFNGKEVDLFVRIDKC